MGSLVTMRTTAAATAAALRAILPALLITAATALLAGKEIVADAAVAAVEIEVVGEAAVEVDGEVILEEGILVDGEVEIIGGVVAAAAEVEPAPGGDDTAGNETFEPGEDLSASEAILLQLDFNPVDERYQERAGSLFLGPESLADVRQRIADLDAEDFRARNEASKRLAMVEAPIEHMLGAARAEAGIEMGRRIQSILNVRVKKRPVDALYHAAVKVGDDQQAGYVDRLLAMASTFVAEHHWELMRAFEYALARSARKQDEKTLLAAVSGDDAAGRELAAFAVGFRGAGGANAASLPAAVDDDDTLALARARGKAAANGSAAAADLIALLGSGSLRVRHEASTLLREIYGQDLGFAAYDSDERRAAAVDRWKNFVANAAENTNPARLGFASRGEFQVLVGKKPGKTGAVITYTTSGTNTGDHPLSDAMGGIDPNTITFAEPSGLVVASGGGEDGGRITVLTPEGRELWSVSGFPSGGGCAALPGGKLLVATGAEVEHLDVTGNAIARWALGSPISAFHQIRPGRFLCCHPETGTVAEYGDDGQLIWSQAGFSKPSYATRLQNGNLLVVVEPAPEGEDGAQAKGPQLLETSPDGKTVISTIRPKGVRQVTAAVRLPNGNTLVGTEKGLAEYTPAGFATKVWIKTAISSLHVR